MTKLFLKRKKGNAMPFAIAIAFSILLIMCGIFEYMKLLIITTGIRNAVQSAVISSVVENYDEAYPAIREGYSGGYAFTSSGWQEQLDNYNIFLRLDGLLSLTKDGIYHIRYINDSETEYKLSNLQITTTNAPFTSNSPGATLNIEAILDVEIPVSFANTALLPLKINMRVMSSYTPKF